MKLIAHRYGKSRVRVLKMLRDGDVHTIRELTARVLLEGDFDASFTAGDNRLVVATDTMKNTVNVLAHEHLGARDRAVRQRLADHFRGRYEHVSRVGRGARGARVDPPDRWRRASPAQLRAADAARGFTRLVADRGHQRHESGVTGMTLLKSTGSGFEDFHRDDLRRSPRRPSASWPPRCARRGRGLARQPATPPRTDASSTRCSCRSPNATARRCRRRCSRWRTPRWTQCPEIDRITLAMPNLHCLPIDLQAVRPHQPARAVRPDRGTARLHRGDRRAIGGRLRRHAGKRE